MTRTGPHRITDRQRACWEALNRYRGVRGAADALGVSPFSIRTACESYMRHMGMEGPLPFTKVYRSRLAGQELADAQRRIDQQALELRSLREQLDAAREENARLAALAHPWVAVHAKLDALLARPVGSVAPTHRRIADGGVGGKRERKPRPMAIPA
jgi:hypothetical protein